MAPTRNWLQFDGAPAAQDAASTAPATRRQRCHTHCPASWLALILGTSVVALALAAVATILRVLYATAAARPGVAAPRSIPFYLRVGFSVFSLAGYRVALMSYNGTVPGPVLAVAPGTIVQLHVENSLPTNRALRNDTSWPCWHPPPAWTPPFHSSGHGADESGSGGHLQPSESAVSPADYVNSPHAFRSTNFHLHGLQVSPTEDNPFLSIGPGSQLRIDVHIPEFHPDGLFWYHPHAHGASAVQLENGMAGAILVRSNSSSTSDSSNSSGGNDLEEVLLVVQQLDLVALSPGSLSDIAAVVPPTALGDILSEKVYGFDPLSFACPGRVGDGFQRGGFDLSLMLVGGVPVAVSPGTATITWQHTGLQPNITLSAGGAPVLLRVLNASPGRPYMLALGLAGVPPPRGSPPVTTWVSLTLVAVDGMTLTAPVNVVQGLPLTAPGLGIDVSGGLLLPPGGRYDLMAHGVAETAGSALPTLWGNVAYCGVGTPACPGLSPFQIASFIVAGTLLPAAGNISTDTCSAGCSRGSVPPAVQVSPAAAPPLPPLLRPIDPSEVVARRRFVLSEQRDPPPPLASGDDGSVNRDVDPLSLTGTGFYINNRTFDPARVDVPGVALGSAEEWWLDNPSPAHGHPWHVHTRPFEVVAVCALPLGSSSSSFAASSPCGDLGQNFSSSPNLLQQPYWSDTVWVPAGARVATRLRFTAFPGRSLFHCHILPHEDLGMMGIYEVAAPLAEPGDSESSRGQAAA